MSVPNPATTDWVPLWNLGTGPAIPPVVNGQWLKGVGGVAVWATITQTDVPAQRVTALPASPVDGQECVLVDNVSAPNYAWRFRFSSAATSFGWDFIGGCSYDIADSTAFVVPSAGTWTKAAAPVFTIPRSGSYVVESYCDYVNNPGAAAVAWVSPGTTGSFAGAANWIPSGQNVGVPSCRVRTTFNLGDVVGVWCYGGVPNMSFALRRLSITPCRVA